MSTTIGFALCGSFCTFSRALEAMQTLAESGYEILPIFSANAATINTRFGNAKDFIEKAEAISKKRAIVTIEGAEPIGPKQLTDLMLVAPCTGNTLAKLANSITDTSVTMAVKSHLRGARPVLLAISTNDALAASAQNIGRLMNRKHYYFVPFSQDSPFGKPNSLIADFSQIPNAVKDALSGKQTQPILLQSNLK